MRLPTGASNSNPSFEAACLHRHVEQVTVNPQLQNKSRTAPALTRSATDLGLALEWSAFAAGTLHMGFEALEAVAPAFGLGGRAYAGPFCSAIAIVSNDRSAKNQEGHL